MTKEEYNKEARAAIDSGDFAKARQIGEAMVNEGMHNGYFHMSVADHLMGNLSQADQEIKAYLTEFDDADGWQQYGLVRLESGDYLKAAEFFDKSAERGTNSSLGFAAAARYIYANQHKNDDPNNVDKNSMLFDLVETAIAQSVQCIQTNPRDYEFYGMFAQMIYLDYSMVAAGRAVYTHVDRTWKNLYGETRKESYNSYGPGGSSLMEMYQSMNNQENTTEQQKAFCKKRAAQIAQILRDAGKEAEASMVMFEMLFAEVTTDGKGSSAPKAAQYYTQALETARASLSDEAYKAWTEEFSDATDDYFTLMKQYGKKIKKAKENGGKTGIDQAKEKFGLIGIIYAIGKTSLLTMLLPLAGGLMVMFGRTAGNDGNSAGMIGLIIFGIIFLIIGIIVGVKRNWEANTPSLVVGEILLFVLSAIHIIAGLVVYIIAKILATIWDRS